MNQFQQLIWKTMYTVDWRQFVDVTHCTAKYVADEVPALKVADTKFYDNVYLCTFIDAPTGSGKNYYATQVLAKEAKEHNRKILILNNRNALGLQQKLAVASNMNFPPLSDIDMNDLMMIDNIVFLTYQSVPTTDFSEIFGQVDPAYIVFDEAHFLCADAIFNASTESILFSILSRYPLVPRVYMSATLDAVKRPIMSFEYNLDDIIADPTTKYTYQNVVKTTAPKSPATTMYEIPYTKLMYKEYRLEPNYQYASLCFFKNWQTIKTEIDREIKAGNTNKWLIFVREKETGKELCDYFSNKVADFISADSTANSSRVKNSLASVKKFPKKVLISTSYLDNGVSIYDGMLKNIVIDFFDKTEFIQMLGRKRVDINETITVYARTPTKQDIDVYSESANARVKRFEQIENNPISYILSHWGKLATQDQQFINVWSQVINTYMNQTAVCINASTSIFTRYALSTQSWWYNSLSAQVSIDSHTYEKQVCQWLKKNFLSDMLREDVSSSVINASELKTNVIACIEDCISNHSTSNDTGEYLIPAEAIKDLGNQIQQLIKGSLCGQKEYGVVVGKGAANVRNVIESMELPYELSDKGSGTAKNTYRLARKPSTGSLA